MQPHWSRAEAWRGSCIILPFRCHDNSIVKWLSSLTGCFLIPFTIPNRCIDTNTISKLVSGCSFLPMELLQDIRGGWQQREGGREFPGHLLAPLTYYLPQLEQRPSLPHPPPTTLPLIPMFVFPRQPPHCSQSSSTTLRAQVKRGQRLYRGESQLVCL